MSVYEYPHSEHLYVVVPPDVHVADVLDVILYACHVAFIVCDCEYPHTVQLLLLLPADVHVAGVVVVHPLQLWLPETEYPQFAVQLALWFELVVDQLPNV